MTEETTATRCESVVVASHLAGSHRPLKDHLNMAFSLANLLIHSEAVPLKAREALRAVSAAPLELRKSALRSAARVLHAETSIDCGDALELVGLHVGSSCD